TSDRAAELARRLDVVRGRVATACDDVGRDASDVTLVVVTKYFPAVDVRILADLGVTDVAENRHQEAAEKEAVCSDLGLRWHFVGGLQSNKAAAVTSYADLVQSVDRAKLLAPLARGAAERGSDLDILIQVSLDPPGSAHRSGVAPGELGALADRADGHEHLRLRGVMAVAPLDSDPAEAFDRLAEMHAEVLRDHPGAQWRSAGMSGDLEDAVRRGATHVRVGSAVLGSRPSVK
ncbi:MAG: YggS family pyridoxal phosphate-dependent enzyme, partial [Nocardioides sp.]